MFSSGLWSKTYYDIRSIMQFLANMLILYCAGEELSLLPTALFCLVCSLLAGNYNVLLWECMTSNILIADLHKSASAYGSLFCSFRLLLKFFISLISNEQSNKKKINKKKFMQCMHLLLRIFTQILNKLKIIFFIKATYVPLNIGVYLWIA